MADLNRYSEEVRDDLEDLEEQMSEREEQMEVPLDYGSPVPEKKDTVFGFFLKILGMGDTSKSGNLNKEELGMLPASVRNYQDIAAYNRAEGCDIVARYLDNKAQIVLGTSLSRDGFFLKTAVTQIKTESKTRKWDESKKQSWFSGFKKQEGGE